MTWTAEEYGGWWDAIDPRVKPAIVARATAGLDFLRRYAGPESEWFVRAQQLFLNKGDNQSIESGARAVGDVLREWVRQVEAGVIDIPGARSTAERAMASTDLMEQVRRLLEEVAVHPAVPIALAGAALEVALKGAVEVAALCMEERPSLAAYARRLRQESLLTAQDMKDVEAMAGLRNSAAHGDFEALSPERAGLMEQQVNLFLGRLLLLVEAL